MSLRSFEIPKFTISGSFEQEDAKNLLLIWFFRALDEIVSNRQDRKEPFFGAAAEVRPQLFDV